MTEIINVKVDVTKIEKERLFKGKKGTYVDLVLIATRNNEYGDYIVKQAISKEEHDKGVNLPIIGNAKIFSSNQKTKSKTDQNMDLYTKNKKDDDFEVPF